MHTWTWFQMISSRITEANVHVVTAAFVLVLLSAAAVVINRRYRNPEEHLVPPPRGGLGNIFEVILEGVMSLMRQTMGERAPRYFPLITTLFIYILTCNLLGVVPGFLPPTDNINTNLACALTVFFYYNVMGIREHGFKNYLRHFMGPIVWLGPLMLVIELISHLVRPVSLSLRLFGNINGDHLVLSIFQSLVPFPIPIAFLALGVFVSFIQAFVFSLLATIYIALATEHGEETHYGIVSIRTPPPWS